MTLNITVFSKDFILQASDRCLSVDARPLPKQRNKAVVFLSKRLKAAITYTGFAGFTVDDDARPHGIHAWLAEKIACPECDGWDAKALAHRIQQEADQWFPTLPIEPSKRRTAFVVAGWDMPNARPRGYFVDNFLDGYGKAGSQCRSSFDVRPMGLSTPDHYLGIADAVRRARRKPIRRAIHSGAPVEKVTQSVVDAIRSAARIEPLVSADCLTVVLSIEGKYVQSWFDAGSERAEFYGPMIVTCHKDRQTTLGDLEAVGSRDVSFEMGDLSHGLGVRVSRGERRGRKGAPADR